MYRVFRPCFALILTLMLVVTGQSMAVARGASGPVGQMVICTGIGPVVVTIDETGAPTGPLHICPDCALSLLVAVAVPDFAVHRAQGKSKRLHVAPVAVLSSGDAFKPSARDPPAAV
jgi:hypothetical protein